MCRAEQAWTSNAGSVKSVRMQGRPKRARRREIKGAARRSVRPKSREETPKEGSETGNEVTSLATPI
jgi:hypothetical protein